MNCDFEEGRIALSYPVDDAVDPRLDPIPAAGNPVNCDFEALSYPVDYTDDPRLDPIPAASNLVQHLTVSCIISADRYFDAVRDESPTASNQSPQCAECLNHYESKTSNQCPQCAKGLSHYERKTSPARRRYFDKPVLNGLERLDHIEGKPLPTPTASRFD